MADDYIINSVGADDYWIQCVGGIECVGGPPKRYCGDRYIPDYDDDSDDMKGSTVAGLWEDIGDYSHDELAGYVGFNIFKAAGKAASGAVKSVGKAVKTVAKPAGKLTGDVVNGLNTVARTPGKVVNSTVGKIPGVGKPLAAAIKLSPQEALGGLTAKVMAGERLDKAFLSSAKGQVAAVKDVAPYVSTVMSFVPGVGTGVAAAIAAGTALAEGRTITDAVLSAARNAVPGGQLGALAFDAALAATKGQSLDRAALTALRKQLPPAAQKAVDVGLKLASGKNAKEVLLRELQKSLPPDARKALDVGIALGVGRTIQSTVMKKAASKPAITELAKQGQIALKKVPLLKKVTTGMPKERVAGFSAAIGAATKAGANAHTLATIRSKLGPAQRAGFDHGINTLVNKANPQWVTLVHGGIVSRGNFRAAKAGEKGIVKGRLIKGGKVQKGAFVRQ